MYSSKKPPFVPESVLLVLDQLSKSTPYVLSDQAKRLAIAHLIAQRECVICNAGAGQWCRTYGWTGGYMRTHPARLRMTRPERERVARWALREELRRARKDTGDGAAEEDAAQEDDNGGAGRI